MRHLTLRELARRVGVSPSLISQIETGRSQPSVGTLYAIATELEVSVDDLLFDGDDTRPERARRRAARVTSSARARRPRAALAQPARDLARLGRALGAADDPARRRRRVPGRRLRRRRRLERGRVADAPCGPRVRPRAERPPRRDARVRGARARGRRLDLLRLDDAAPPRERGRRAGARDLVRGRARRLAQASARACAAEEEPPPGAGRRHACTACHPHDALRRRSRGAALAPPAFADSTPIGPLPKGPVTTITTHRGLLVAVALPHPAASKGLVWRLARPVDPSVLRQVSEADVGKNVVVVYRVIGKGKASIVYALTRGDALVEGRARASPTRSAST